MYYGLMHKKPLSNKIDEGCLAFRCNVFAPERSRVPDKAYRRMTATGAC